MTWAESLRSVEARDHVYVVTEKEDLHRVILPAFIRRAVGLRGEVEVWFPSSDQAALESSLASAIPELDKWRASGLVRFREGDPLFQLFMDPTPGGLRRLRSELAGNYRNALSRGRTMWYAGGVGGQLIEEGHMAQALFVEMFLQNVHWVVPMAMLCPFYPPLDDSLREGLEEVHDGGV